MITFDDIRNNKDKIIQIAACRGASHIRIFGSIARGEERPESDLDLLVDFEPGRSLIDYVGLIQDLREYLGYDVDVVTEKGLSSHIRERILQEAVPLGRMTRFFSSRFLNSLKRLIPILRMGKKNSCSLH